MALYDAPVKVDSLTVRSMDSGYSLGGWSDMWVTSRTEALDLGSAAAGFTTVEAVRLHFKRLGLKEL